MKSAYELAMARLNETQGEVKSLTDDQRQRLAAVAKDFEARIAEQELALKPRIDAAIVQGQPEEAVQLRDTLENELRKLREKEEEAKQAIRDEG